MSDNEGFGVRDIYMYHCVFASWWHR